MQGTKEPWGSLHLHIQVTSSTKLPDLQCTFKDNFQCFQALLIPHFWNRKKEKLCQDRSSVRMLRAYQIDRAISSYEKSLDLKQWDLQKTFAIKEKA